MSGLENIVIPTKEEKIKRILDFHRGKFFTVHFHSKKDGRLCKINGRTGVVKHLKGGKSNAAGKEDLKVVFNVHKMAYRTINLSGVVKLSCGGESYVFE